MYKGTNTSHIRNYKHGHSSRKKVSPEYKAYYNMIQRCYNPNTDSAKYYYGRSIKVCERWLDLENGFRNFFKDMGPKPGPEYSLDREDSDGNYEPNNCRWATAKEQAENRRVREDSRCGPFKYEGPDLFG
jgi:hypothetical protein